MTASPVKRAVLVLPEPPFPPTCGNALRDVQQVALLRLLGYSVVVLCVRPRMGSTASVDRNKAAGHGVEVEFISERREDGAEGWCARIRRKLGYLRPGNRAHPFAWWCTSYGLPVGLAERLAAIAPAAIVLRSLFLDALPLVRTRCDATVVVDCHDADVHLAREMVRSVTWWQSLGPMANYCGVRALYRSVLPLADEIWAVSAEDAQRIRPYAGPKPVLVVPSAVDEKQLVPAAEVGSDDVCALVANYEYGPNLSAARWLVRRVWPSVKRARSGARLLLVGKGAHVEMRELAARGAGVEAIGCLEDLSPVYTEAGVMLAPLHHGGGSRLKIVEAWKHGKAVLATSKGMEGIGAPSGTAVVRDLPGPFADALAGLMGDSPERRRLGEAGRRFVAEHLSHGRVGGDVRSRSVLSHFLPAGER